MNFVINTKELMDLTLDEALFLLSLHQKTPINRKTMESLNRKGYLFKYDSSHIPEFELTRNGVDIIERVVLNSEFQGNTSSKGRFENLAEKLMELYPDGKKEGTAYYWKGSVAIIAKKLKALVKKFGDVFTDEQAIEATRKYIDSFNGNYTYMQLLKYFILKQKVIDGSIEEESQLLSYIENDGKDTNTRDDWMSTLV